MNNNTSPTACHLGPLDRLSHLTGATQRRVLSAAQLRAHGVSAASAGSQCRPGGPWQLLLPGVYLLRQGPPTSEERLHAALLYAGRPGQEGGGGLPEQAVAPYGAVMITGLAALALYGFTSAPSLLSLGTIDVLVPRTRRLRSTGCARLIRAHALPRPEQVTGVPVAPVARALADAVSELPDAAAVRRLLTEAVRAGHCEPSALVNELRQARLLERPQVADAVDALLAEGRALAEDRLYEMVRAHGLPEPVWNVELRLPGAPSLGGVDAYWPEQAVAVELYVRAPHQGGKAAGDPLWSEHARKREHLERLGVTVVHLTPEKLRDSPGQQASVVRTALTAADDRDPAAYVLVLPR
ncbi:hypothetical protein [Streptomyces sp. NPDC088725]|uniref:hypothetical protein n=1 Tax=Streptomyces sp. NPDC088725 TaxID=3365873 RepID=UPI00382560E1